MANERIIKLVGGISIIYGIIGFIHGIYFVYMFLSLGFLFQLGSIPFLLNFIISIFFIVSGANLLRRKKWARILLVILLLLTILSSIIFWIIFAIAPRGISFGAVTAGNIIWETLKIIIIVWFLKILFNKKIKKILNK